MLYKSIVSAFVSPAVSDRQIFVAKLALGFFNSPEHNNGIPPDDTFQAHLFSSEERLHFLFLLGVMERAGLPANLQ